MRVFTTPRIIRVYRVSPRGSFYHLEQLFFQKRSLFEAFRIVERLKKIFTVKLIVGKSLSDCADADVLGEIEF